MSAAASTNMPTGIPTTPPLISPAPETADTPAFNPALFSFDSISINPLAEACNTPLALLTHICEQAHLNDTDALMHVLGQSLSDLRADLDVREDYDPISKRIAHYCLCAMADSVIISNQLAEQTTLVPESFLDTWFKVDHRDRKIYDLALRLLRQPEKYRDILELIYLCCHLGFDQSNDQQDHLFSAKRQHVLDNIRQQFTEKWQSSVGLPALAIENIQHTPYKIKINLPTWPIYIMSAVVLGSLYWLFNQRLDEKANILIETLNKF